MLGFTNYVCEDLKPLFKMINDTDFGIDESGNNEIPHESIIIYSYLSNFRILSDSVPFDN